ncbi:AtpZ/AtpI family protein [Nocardioides sp.]|jgi:F0F1-type ATP synthase assembly protein I|uniref:AtpZ/AtpI family protein n=1 Tax=Nocardioides sp. TaxID=35761 RepID=UPI002F40FBFB
MADGHPDPTLRGRDLAGLGGMLAGAVVLGTVLGLLVDHAAGTTPAFTLVGLALGIASGAGAFWVRVRSVLR